MCPCTWLIGKMDRQTERVSEVPKSEIAGSLLPQYCEYLIFFIPFIRIERSLLGWTNRIERNLLLINAWIDSKRFPFSHNLFNATKRLNGEPKNKIYPRVNSIFGGLSGYPLALLGFVASKIKCSPSQHRLVRHFVLWPHNLRQWLRARFMSTLDV